MFSPNIHTRTPKHHSTQLNSTQLNSQLRLSNDIQLAPLPHRAAVDRQRRGVDVRARPAAQVHHRAGDVLGPPEPAHRVPPPQLLGPAPDLQQAVGHLAREEARRDAVDADAPGPELERQVAAQVQRGRLARAVPVRAVAAERADAEPGHARRDDDPRRVRQPLLPAAPGGDGLFQQRREEPHRVEHGAHVEVEHLGDGGVRVRVELLAPRGARVGEQDVDAVRVRRHLVDEALHALDRRRVGRHRDGAGPGRQVGQGVERGDGLLAGLGLAGRDEDLGRAGLEDATCVRAREVSEMEAEEIGHF
ncbi:uncharacterized protein E0L32_009818 [Thyridium curvatum]|uniref:Uncharacterized protein n=1 Tax=Thyridium curvatum TaxID=1093900 RepID=A0A507APU7_9PEZI|nr:uncharacterized protein E0L32_009818 [Thyridium curvatum]TPX08756.1 hypothetical protein E0L32_009818 [Thyridium curvatum]